MNSTSEEYAAFCAALVDILETSTEELSQRPLHQFDGFDSMAVIDIALFIEESFDWQIPFDEVSNAGFASDLFERILAARNV